MMNKIKSFLLLTLVLALSSCGNKIEVQGALEEKSYEVGVFNKISVANGIRIAVKKGEVGSITVRTFTSVFEYVDAHIEDNVLIVKLKSGVDFNRDPNIRVTIPANMIVSLGVNGAVFAELEKGAFSDNMVDLILSEGSLIEGEVITNTMKVNLSGGSNIAISGNASNCEVIASGGSNIDCKLFRTSILNTNLSDGSRLYIQVLDRIENAVLSGGSNLFYRGENAIIVSEITSGGSKIGKF